MSEENSKSEQANPNVSTETAKENKIEDTTVLNQVTDEAIKNTTADVSVEDLSKVKIRHVLMQRLKNSRLSFKKVVAFILMAAIFFSAGFFTDRALTQHRLGRNFNGRPGINRNMKGNFFGNGKMRQNGNGGQVPQNQWQGPAQNQ